MIEVSTTRGTILKGRSIRKREKPAIDTTSFLFYVLEIVNHED